MRFFLLLFPLIFFESSKEVLASADDFTPSPIFVENFTKTIDSNIWEILHLRKPDGGKQVYIKQAVHTDQAGLHIIASHEAVDDKTLELKSGALQTRQSFLYGRFEFLAKFPKGTGFWPALWLDEKPWAPISNEIDVIEAWGSHPNALQSTLQLISNGKHIGYVCAQIGLHKFPCSDNSHIFGANVPDLTAEYHVYTLEWLPDHITWLLDGKQYYTVTRDIPNVPMHIIINFAMGNKNWDGPITPETPFPASFDVKMVKVWALKSQPQ